MTIKTNAANLPFDTESGDKKNPYNIYYDNYMSTNAATECTGLGYLLPLDLDQWNAYRTVFDFLPVPFQDLEDS